MLSTTHCLPDTYPVELQLDHLYGAADRLADLKADNAADGFVDPDVSCELGLISERIEQLELLLKVNAILEQICAAQSLQKRIYCPMREWQIIILRTKLGVLTA